MHLNNLISLQTVAAHFNRTAVEEKTKKRRKLSGYTIRKVEYTIKKKNAANVHKGISRQTAFIWK